MSEAPLTEAAALASGGATGGVKGAGFVTKQARASHKRFAVSEKAQAGPALFANYYLSDPPADSPGDAPGQRQAAVWSPGRRGRGAAAVRGGRRLQDLL